MSRIHTKMFDLLLIFFHKGFMLLLLLLFGLFNIVRFDINNALWMKKWQKIIIRIFGCDTIGKVISDITGDVGYKYKLMCIRKLHEESEI